MTPSQKIPREQRLKSDTQIQNLFSSGKSLFAYPIKVQYFFETKSEASPDFQFGVSASKKSFKKAVDRNALKRKMREAVRINKHVLEAGLDGKNKQLVLMFLFVGKTKSESKEIHSAIEFLIRKLNKKLL